MTVGGDGGMISPCWHCEKRTVVPNCHPKCKRYKAFMDKRKAERHAMQKDAQVLDDIKTVRRRVIKLSAEIKGRAKGEKE